MKISPEVMAVLSRCSTRNNALFLPEQLDRQMYLAVNKALDALGFKWNRKERAHLLTVPGQPLAGAEEALDSVLLTGEVIDRARTLQQFFSPIGVVEELVDASEPEPGMDVLEPSSGNGAIALYLHHLGCRVRAIEIDAQLAEVTRAAGIPTVCQDFLTMTPSPIFDRVVMNPPFNKRQEAAHVLHALAFLRPGGRLTSIMSAGIEYRQDGMYAAVREEIDKRGGKIIRLPQQSFKVSGTEVNTCLVTIDAGGLAPSRAYLKAIASVQARAADTASKVVENRPAPKKVAAVAADPSEFALTFVD